MKYVQIKRGIFLDRPNRFLAEILIDGREEQVHVKNTGRCRELLIPGVQVVVEHCGSLLRKTQYSLIGAYKRDMFVNMDSQVPNAVVAEALGAGNIREIGRVTSVKREVTYRNSRFDIYYEKGDVKGFVEVKGVTLEKNGVAAFPDAPTKRGVKHLEELILAKKEGYEAAVLFLVQMQGPDCFLPNGQADPDFAKTLMKADAAGVKILIYDCKLLENEIVLGNPLSWLPSKAFC